MRTHRGKNNSHLLRDLIALKGVDNVELSGAMPMEWRVDYSPEKLSTLGLSPDDLSNAISERENAGCDTLDAAKVFLTARDGHIVALSDVARVSRREAEPTGYFRINGLNSIYLNLLHGNTGVAHPRGQ